MKKKVLLVVSAVLILFMYIFAAAQPILPETVLVNQWLNDLNGENGEEETNADGFIVPFTLGSRFGYVDSGGKLVFNKAKEKYVSISGEYWSEYAPAPEEIVIQKPDTDSAIILSPARGYPVFLDGRIFVAGKDQCSLEELDENGNIIWSYDFGSPLTSFDASGGYTLAGTLDGIVELLDNEGNPVFPAYSPAARIPVIFSCRISSDASKIALVAGIDQQRFLFLERYGTNDYRVTYHEFLRGEGFRREPHMAFINNDTAVVFEQENGLGIFDVKTRTRRTLPLDGKIEVLDGSGDGGLLFFISSPADNETKKRFIALNLSGGILINAPFTGENAFLARRGNALFVGGGTTLALFKLDRM